MTQDERRAIEAAERARHALENAIAAYEVAGFGSLVTDPLRDALSNVEHSILEVKKS